ncbi:MAG TPA: hypothetical protein V6C95_23560 [Coleofasciculaceae cyanobacterium]
MEELKNGLAESIEALDFLLETSQAKLLEEILSHLLKTRRISVTTLLFAVKSTLLAHDSRMLPVVQAIEATEGAATAVLPKEEKS